LSNATGATLGAPAAATVTITSDDVVAVTLSGIAATGAPIIGATLTVVDAAGTTREATTGADGTYSLDVGGMVPPFLVQVDMGGGAALFSVSNAESPELVNVHPLTDLVIRAWYSVQGGTVEDAFADPVANPAPSPDQVAFIVNVVRAVVQSWLTAAGLDATTFDLIATPFDADGSGFDGVLDITVVDPDTGGIAIDDGTTSQQATLSTDATGGTLSVTSTTTGAGGTSTSSTTSVIPTAAGASDILAQINTSLTMFKDAVNDAGDALTADDLLAFFATDTLNDGLDRELTAANFASNLRDATLDRLRLTRVTAFTDTSVTGVVEVRLSDGNLVETDTLELTFTLESGTWKLAGDRRVADASVEYEQRIDQGSGGNTIFRGINIDVSPLSGVVSSVTITGGGLFEDTPVPDSGSTEIEELEPAPGESIEIERDSFFHSSGYGQDVDVAAGTEFTLTMTLAAGGTASESFVTGGSTNEVVMITSPTGHTLADAMLGEPLTFEWELPTTIAIVSIDASGLAFTASGGMGGFTCFSEDGPLLPVTATSMTVTIPTTCGGDPVVAANLNVSFNGVNGERIQIIYSMED
jgi:hypothetical protein